MKPRAINKREIFRLFFCSRRENKRNQKVKTNGFCQHTSQRNYYYSSIEKYEFPLNLYFPNTITTDIEHDDKPCLHDKAFVALATVQNLISNDSALEKRTTH